MRGAGEATYLAVLCECACALMVSGINLKEITIKPHQSPGGRTLLLLQCPPPRPAKVRCYGDRGSADLSQNQKCLTEKLQLP